MNKTFARFFAASLACSAFFSFSACQNKKINLKLAEIHLDGYPTSLADKEFAHLVEKRTNGRIHIEVYSGGILYQDETESIKALINGEIDFARVSSAPISEFVPKINLVNLPYLFRDREHMWQVLNSEIGQEILDEIEKSDLGISGLCYYDADCRSFYSTKPIRTLKDMQGKRIRVMNSSLMKDIVDALGGVGVTNIPSAEVYSAIQNGLVDGAENNWATYENMGDFLVAPYYTQDRHTWIPEILLASKQALSKLSQRDFELVKSCAKDVQSYEIEKNIEKQVSAKEKARQSGTTVIELSDGELQKFKDSTAKIYDKYAGNSKDTIEKIRRM